LPLPASTIFSRDRLVNDTPLIYDGKQRIVAMDIREVHHIHLESKFATGVIGVVGGAFLAEKGERKSTAAPRLGFISTINPRSVTDWKCIITCGAFRLSSEGSRYDTDDDSRRPLPTLDGTVVDNLKNPVLPFSDKIE
jgi:hypothetical protein